MDKQKVSKSLLGINIVLNFALLISLILPVFDCAKATVKNESKLSIYGFELILRLINGKIAEPSIIIFVAFYIAIIVCSFFFILKLFTTLKTKNYYSKNNIVTSVIISIFSIIVITFAFVIASQPNAALLIGEEINNPYNVSFVPFLLLVSCIAMVVMFSSINKINKKMEF